MIIEAGRVEVRQSWKSMQGFISVAVFTIELLNDN